MAAAGGGASRMTTGKQNKSNGYGYGHRYAEVYVPKLVTATQTKIATTQSKVRDSHTTPTAEWSPAMDSIIVTDDEIESKFEEVFNAHKSGSRKLHRLPIFDKICPM
ncbi:hypothetical protein Nepgr_026364 [Nepenthes gracilis]|uniref:Uncharacterized protein n=1 Tax=Nepenthes gracilis TaxID=150966 RepID=A0AAD3T8G9_NEPGR|nr:hypothetical protein Nepgr_026364 [Nepenthes gracilis]